LLKNKFLKKKVLGQVVYSEESNNEDPNKIFELIDGKFIHLYGASKWYENFNFYKKDEDRKNLLFSIVDKGIVNNNY
jgi:hypothetical protein